MLTGHPVNARWAGAFEVFRPWGDLPRVVCVRRPGGPSEATMSTNSSHTDPLLPRLLPVALGALIAVFALATAMVPPASSGALVAADAAAVLPPVTGVDASVPDAASALRVLGDESAGESQPPTF
jgi:hypothetical protein